jgi:hypothetical protein
MGRKRIVVVVSVVAAGLLGYLLGPPAVRAVAASLVVIKDPQTSSKARVDQGELRVEDRGLENLVGLMAPHGFGPFGCTLRDPDANNRRDIFGGQATEDVRWEVEATCDEGCDGAVITCTYSDGMTRDAGPVPNGGAQTLSCPKRDGTTIDDAILWCKGTSGKCRGTYEAA